MKVGIVVFPGSNCDRDMYHVLGDVFGLDAAYCWHQEPLPDVDAIILPGGFSYGDRLRAGIIAAHSPAVTEIKQRAEAGTPVLGVCNGFQILVEAGLLPGVLLGNESQSFMCQWTNIIVENNTTAFSNRFKEGERIPIPIANGQGRYYADDDTIQELKEGNQVVFRYEDATNGSAERIAGICNKQGNVVGMMPHPERAAEQEINPADSAPSRLIFDSLIRSMA